MEKYCVHCSPVQPLPNVNSNYNNLTGGIFDFNFCPFCGRKLKDEDGKRIDKEFYNGVVQK